jgi:hypothetical protein
LDAAVWLRNFLESPDADPDLMRAMLQAFAEALMSAEASAACGAGYGERSDERVNSRNGYRERRWDTRVGTIDLAIPKLRSGSYYPEWLLTHRRRSEQALASVVAQAYVEGVSTRRVEDLVETMGIAGLSSSQVSRLARELDAKVAEFRERPLDAGPYRSLFVSRGNLERVSGRAGVASCRLVEAGRRVGCRVREVTDPKSRLFQDARPVTLESESFLGVLPGPLAQSVVARRASSTTTRKTRSEMRRFSARIASLEDLPSAILRS